MMTTFNDTPEIPTRETSSIVRSMRSRRHRSILRAHVPSCRVRGFGL